MEQKQEVPIVESEGKGGEGDRLVVEEKGVSMKLRELIGKQVIGGQAQILGKIEEVDLDTTTWKIASLIINLEKTVVEEIGFEKPRIMSSVKVSVPVEEVDAVSDMVTLTKSAAELRGVAKKV